MKLTKIVTSYLLVVLSAFLLIAAYAMPFWCDWLTLIFLVPLFLAVLMMPVSWREGLLWGSLFFGFHLYGVWLLIIEKGEGDIRWPVILILFMYCSLQISFWFWLAQKAAEFSATDARRIIYFSLILFLYFVWQYTIMFWFWGGQFGYCFGMPLLPLAQHPQWLSLLPIFSSYGLLAILIIDSVLLAQYCKTRNNRYLIGWFLGIVPFVYGWVMQPVDTIPAYVASFGYVQPPISRKNLLQCALEINNSVNQLVEQRPDISWIFMPEGSFPFFLNEHPDIVSLISNIACSDQVNIAIGSHKREGAHEYNGLYCLAYPSIMQSYDKKILMPFAEYLPFPWHHCTTLKKLFLKDIKGFNPKEVNSAGALIIDEKIAFFPCICAELYFGNPPKNKPLLCIVNDSWFSTYYMRHLMFLFARFRAIEYKQELFILGIILVLG